MHDVNSVFHVMVYDGLVDHNVTKGIHVMHNVNKTIHIIKLFFAKVSSLHNFRSSKSQASLASCLLSHKLVWKDIHPTDL